MDGVCAHNIQANSSAACGENAENDLLLLSGIQHFVYCPRQWMLIHVEQAWSENLKTVQGAIFHENVHSLTTSKRDGVITSRGMPVISRALGIQGVCDVVEFHPDERGVVLHGHRGRYQPVPVEYKRGRQKKHDADKLQLCAQALCLEEMLECRVPHGFLFYGETRKRDRVILGEEVRDNLKEVLAEMRHCFEAGVFEAKAPKRACGSCSMRNLCMPELLGCGQASSYVSAKICEG
jgi:CRISPR-associated exonuclease Cas4